MYARLHDLTAKPRLFFDLMPPARVSRRRDRIRAWCGPATWRVLEDNHARGHVPAAGGTMLGRSLKPKERIAVAVKSVGRLCLADRVSAPASDHTPGKQLELLAAWRWLLVMWSEIKKQAIDRALGI